MFSHKKLMKKIVEVTKSPSETFNIGFNLASKINSPTIIGLSGELGTGKTIFAKGVAEGLGIKELITSPTFLGINEYYSGHIPLIHMDFYKKVINKENLDFYTKKNAVILIEWFENFNSVFNTNLKPNITVHIKYLRDQNDIIHDNERQIIIEIG